MGKEFGFEDSLLEQIPKVLQKGLDRRRTVDNMVMERMETEFSKEYIKLQGTLQHEQVTFQECGEAMKDAQAILNDSVQAHKTHAKALTQAESMLLQSKMELPKARQGVRKVQVMWDRAVRELDLAEARLEAFRSGPLSAFKALQDGLEATCSSAAPAGEVAPVAPDCKEGQSAVASAVAASEPSTPMSAEPAPAQFAVAPAEAAPPSPLPGLVSAPAPLGALAATSPTLHAAESTESAFPEMSATIAQASVADTSVYADTTLAWAPTVKDIEA